MESYRAVDPPATPGAASSVTDAESDAGRHYDDLVALSRISAAVSELGDLDAILEVALDNVMRIMDGKIGGIMLLDDKSRMLSYRVYRGLSPEYAREMRLQLGEGIAGVVAQSGKSELLEDISSDPRAARPELVRTAGLRAFLSVPLRAKDGVLGVMNVASDRPRRFGKADMHLLHCIGDQVGVAIEQARLRERLRQGVDRYRRLAQQILVAQEQERRRIARELHDETSQALAGLAFNLQALVQMAELSGIQDVRFKTKLREAHDLTNQIAVELSRLTRELRPTLLDTLGLAPALRQYAESSLGPPGIDLSLEFRGSADSLPREVDSGIFRVAQGAISNVARHSQAKSASVTLDCGAKEVFLRVSDDGVGFDVSRVAQFEASGRGRGLFIMKERVALLGGSYSIESQPGLGTEVSVRVPIIRSAAHGENPRTRGG